MSLFRCRDRASADGNLHSSPGGNDQHCSRHIVLHEPRWARSSTFSFGSFKSISGYFNLFCIRSDMSLRCGWGLLFWIVDVLMINNIFAVFLWCYRVGFYIIRTSYTFCLFICSGSFSEICQPRFSLIYFGRQIRNSLSGPDGFIVTISTSTFQILAFKCGRLAFRSGRQK